MKLLCCTFIDDVSVDEEELAFDSGQVVKDMELETKSLAEQTPPEVSLS